MLPRANRSPHPSIVSRVLTSIPKVILSAALVAAGAFIVRPAQAIDCVTSDAAGCLHGLAAEEYNQLLAQMQVYPAPDYSYIPLDESNVTRYTFYKVASNADVYDAPNGNITSNMGEGFYFVNVAGVRDGFGLLRSGGWIRMDQLKKTYASPFTGFLFDKPMQYPIAWVLQTSIPAAKPGGVISLETKAIKRYTKLNIFKTVKVGDWNWYLVAPGTWIEQRKVAKVDPNILPDGAPDREDRAAGIKWVAVDLYEQTLKVYEGNKLLAATLIASGIPPFNTNIGTFKVWQRIGSTPMLGAMGSPDAYNLPAVPFVMFFDKEISLHGAYWHDGFGFKRSHGCVNMTISDSRWLYEWVGDSAELTVVVWSSYNKEPNITSDVTTGNAAASGGVVSNPVVDDPASDTVPAVQATPLIQPTPAVQPTPTFITVG